MSFLSLALVLAASASEPRKPAAPTTVARAAPAAAPSRASKSRPVATPTEIHWTYEGDAGPSHWAELSPEWAKCGAGRAQTPIDINTDYADRIGLDDPVFHYHPLAPKIVNNGHTIEVDLPKGDAIELDGSYYELVQFHFHAPSEHRLNGRQYPMELHLVHKDAEGNLVVVGVFLEPGDALSTLGPVFDGMGLKTGQEKQLGVEVDPRGLVPADHSLLRYEGSLTTPPCSEGVRWVVFTHPMTVSPEQIGAFTKLYTGNARPVQALNGRTLLVDQTAH